MSGLVENENNEKPAHTKRWESGSSWHKLSNYHLTEVLTEQGPHNPLPQKYMTGVRNSRTMGCTGDSDQDHPQEKEMQKDNMVV